MTHRAWAGRCLDQMRERAAGVLPEFIALGSVNLPFSIHKVVNHFVALFERAYPRFNLGQCTGARSVGVVAPTAPTCVW